MKLNSMKRLVIYPVSLSLIFSVTAGCSSSNLIEYSSVAGHEQSVSHIRTEISIIKGDDVKISRDYSVVSAVDYLQDGKKNYYLMIVPGSSSNLKMNDLKLKYEYPYIIRGGHISELIYNVEKISNEWDNKSVSYSGAVYNFLISSPQDSLPWTGEKKRWYEEKKYYEISPYLKFSYGKDEDRASAKLAVGSRIDEIIYTTVDGKTVKSKILFQEDEQSWVFDNSAEMKDFQNLLSKGHTDLKEKGMDGGVKKTVVKEEVKPEVKQEEPPVVKKTKKTKKKKK